jgi:hypothetical protein
MLRYRASDPLTRRQREGALDTLANTSIQQPLTDTLIERVDRLIQASKTPLEWGNPRVSMTPTPVAVQGLAAETTALERAVREIALEVQKLAARG